MNHTNAIEYFLKMASNKDLEQKDVKIQAKNDFSQLDANFILQYTNPQSTLLDIGSGTGLTVNKVYKYVQTITAIEPFEEFTKFIDKSDKITILHENILTFSLDTQFDIITLFGIMQYINREEASTAYTRIKPLLKPEGKLIIKQQFGIKEDITIAGFSEELQQEYYSEYRSLDSEIELLESLGYKNIQIIDIYPPECNRWDNTHFYALIAE